jgi:RNA polymerase sigma-70 factor (ECF subfamily)
LKTICGFTVAAISKAFLVKEETVAQRLVRAKNKIREANLRFGFPEPPDLKPRLTSVAETIYLLFNEGYGRHTGDTLVQTDICVEACRIAKALADHPLGQEARLQALVALLLLQASRLRARVGPQGEMRLLPEQDRSLWDQSSIAEAMPYLERAATGDDLSPYHLLAGIAACHATAPTFEETDWKRILAYYDALCGSNPSPVLRLNRAVALSFVQGPKAALKELAGIGKRPGMGSYYLLPATIADFHRRLGEPDQAARHYRTALEQSVTEPERKFLLRRLQECRSGEAADDAATSPRPA